MLIELYLKSMLVVIYENWQLAINPTEGLPIKSLSSIIMQIIVTLLAPHVFIGNETNKKQNTRYTH